MGEPTIETLAAISAAIETGLDRESSCAEHGLSFAVFESAREQLLKDMADSASREDLQLSRRWSRALAAAQRRATLAARKAKRKPAEDLPTAPPDVHLPVIRAQVPPPAAPAQPAAPLAPTSAGPPPPAMIGAPPPSTMAPTAASGTSPPPAHAVAALPFAPLASPPPPVIAPPPMVAPPPVFAPPSAAGEEGARPPGARKTASLMSTAMSTGQEPAAALPFSGVANRAPGSSPPPRVSATAPPLPPPVAATVPFPDAVQPPARADFANATGSVDPVRVPGPALPFTAAGAPPRRLEEGESAPTQRDPSRGPPSSIPPPGGAPKTMMIDAEEVLRKAGVALPFPVRDASLRADAPASDADQTQPTPAVSLGGALPFRRDSPASGQAAGAPASAPLSSAPAGAPSSSAAAEQRAASFTLAQYARLCAELRAAPDDAPRLRAQYGIDDPTWFALHSLWQSRFRADPGLRFRWDKQVEQIVAKLKTGR